MRGELAKHNERVAKLEIHPVDGSRYFLIPRGNQQPADFEGGYLEFHLMVENTGKRDSTINTYTVYIREFDMQFENLAPYERGGMLRGRHFTTNAEIGLSRTALLRVGSEGVTDRGILIFRIPGIGLETFANAGFVMSREERRFLDPLHCRLTLTDTTGVSASREFEVREA